VNASGSWQERVVKQDGLSRDHVTGKVSYDARPPAGGAHSAAWQNCGVFTVPVVDEAAVHSLEHGAAWFTWRDGLTADEQAFIDGMAKKSQWILASPYPEQTSPFSLTAWGLQLRLDTFDREAIEGFLTTYANGKQTPEPGAPCMGGINTTR
jgi:hypothetical protein